MKTKLTFIVIAFLAITSCRKEINNQQISTKKSTAGIEFKPYSTPSGTTAVTVSFENGKKISLYKKDSSYFLEGDIVLTQKQIDKLKLINSANQSNLRTFINTFISYWKGGDVPFVISPFFQGANRTTILNAITDWENATTLNFRPRTTQTDYIEFNPSFDGNHSNVGRIGGRQFINIQNVDLTTVTHEIGHAIGFYHEQSRADRDNAIVVDWNNIRPEKAYNFKTYIEQGVPGTEIGAFDFNSIMLYPSLITDPNFVYNTTIPTMQQIGGGVWGWNFVLSNGDIETTDFIYGPPYARIEYLVTVNDTYATYGEDFEHQEGNFYVNLYSDEQCTIPFTTPVDKNVEVRLVENMTGYITNWDFTVLIPAGFNERTLAENVVTREYHAVYGTAEQNDTRIYEGNSAFFRGYFVR